LNVDSLDVGDDSIAGDDAGRRRLGEPGAACTNVTKRDTRNCFMLDQFIIQPPLETPV
jgi:hypothetical protein